MRRLGWMLAVVLAVGCKSTGEPDDVLFLLGRVHDEAGAAVTGTEVLLERRSSRIGCQLDLPDVLDEPWQEVARGTTDGQGGYLFELQRYLTLAGSTDYAPACMRVRLTRGAEGGSVEVRVTPGKGDMPVPDVPLWAGRPAVHEEGEGVQVRFAPEASLPPSPLPFALPHMVDWQLEAEAGVLWREEASGEAVALEGALWEDFTGVSVRKRAVAEGWYEVSGLALLEDTMEVRMDVQSGRMPLSAPGRMPVSRGARCARDGEELQGCPLTDGALAPVDLAQLEDRGGVQVGMVPEVVEVWWEEPRQVRLLLLRGVEQDVAVEPPLLEGSSDGETWEVVGTLPWRDGSSQEATREDVRVSVARGLDGRFWRIPLSSERPLSRLRIRQGKLRTLTELSVFD